MNQKQFFSIVTHTNPHLDEIVAIWMLQRFGEERFPGISTATISYWSTGGTTPDGRSAVEYEENGVLLVGVGGGRFDEHPTNSAERKQGECAATLVAKALDIEDNPALERILKYVTQNDLQGSTHPFEVATITKILHQQHPDKAEVVINWALIAIEAKYYEQLQFWTSTKEAFEKTAKIEEVRGPHGRMLTVVSIESDDEQIGKFARSAHGANAAVVIQKRTSGNVQIFTNKKFGVTLYDVAQMLRLEEQRAKGGAIRTTDWKVLSSEGTVDGCEEWFYHHEMQMLLNESTTAKNVQPTRLSMEKIRWIIRMGINPHAFESSRASSCENGTCTSGDRNRCPWYSFKLNRCRRIRFEQKRAQG